MFIYKNANDVASCYLEAGKTYTLNLPGSNFVSGTVSIDKISDAIDFGDNEVDMEIYDREIFVFSIDEADTFNFVSDTDGNLDCYLYSTEGFVNRTSGTNDISDDDKDFNARYDLPAGSYLFMVQAKTDLTGTYNVSHTNHIKETLARVAPTCYSEGRQAGTRCKVCGRVYSGLGVLPIVDHSFTNFVYNNNATLSKDGTESAYCDYGCGVRYTRTKKGTKTGLSAPVMKSAVNTATGVTVSWNAVSGAAKYRVYYMTLSSGWKAVGNTSNTSYAVTGLTSGTVYGFTVRCITADEKSFTSDYDDVAGIVYLSSVKPTVSNTTTGVSVKWSKVTGASSSFTGASTVTVKSASTVSQTISSLTKGTTYYVRVRTYRNINSVNYFSAWSSAKSVKVS